jgi:hypothetical protein
MTSLHEKQVDATGNACEVKQAKHEFREGYLPGISSTHNINGAGRKLLKKAKTWFRTLIIFYKIYREIWCCCL